MCILIVCFSGVPKRSGGQEGHGDAREEKTDHVADQIEVRFVGEQHLFEHHFVQPRCRHAGTVQPSQ